MRALAIALLVLLGAAIPLHAADPLQGVRPAVRTSAAPMPSIAGRLIAASARAQRDLNAVIAAKFRVVGEAPSLPLVAGILALSFAYGVLHAVGPGHGKLVVAAYVTARRERWIKSVAFASLISLVQGVSAVLIVGALGLVLSWAQHDVLEEAVVAEIVSYALIGLLGLWMLYLALTGRADCADHRHEHDVPPGKRRPGDGIALAVSAGLTPCASAIIVLLFALANSVFAIGIAAALAMSAGMAITVSAIGLLSLAGRRGVERLFAGSAAWAMRLERMLQVVGPALLVACAAILLLGASAQL